MTETIDLYTLSKSDTFDSRDVAARIEALLDSDDDWDKVELTALLLFADEASAAFEDWSYGVMFIADDYFVEYAQDYADEIGHVDESWPHTHIDWQAAADDLRQDYSSIELDGRTYWAR